MNIGYVYSIITLYLEKENTEKKTHLLLKKQKDKVNFSFRMQEDGEETTFDIPMDLFNANINTLLEKFKTNQIIIDEKYEIDKSKKICYYRVQFQNGRVISFDLFPILDLNNIRNNLYNIQFEKDKLRIDQINKEISPSYKSTFTLQPTGFASFFVIFISVIFFSGVFIAVLWICKLLMK